MKSKTCYKCSQALPTTAFNKKGTAKDGLQSQCRECQKSYKKAHYDRNKRKYQRLAKERTRDVFRKVQEHKVENGCKNCGENHPACLDFHHRDSKDKEIIISGAIRLGWGWRRILLEIEKCDVLCANCHRKEHWADAPLD